jgi:hypothetical protein
MLGYCAKCGRSSKGHLLCPHCGTELADTVTRNTVDARSDGAIEELPDGPSFLRRLSLGMVTLLGLYHGIKHATLAGALAYSGADIISAEGLIGMLVAATLAASLVAGTVNRRAELTGFLVGMAAACGTVGVDVARGTPPPEEWLIGAPTLLILVGSIGGIAGRMLIPPAPALPTLDHFERVPASKVKLPKPRLIWWRIALGLGLVVIGTNAANDIRQLISTILAGHAGSFGLSRLFNWQISVICALLGGVAAGANTRCGFRQGAATGVLAGTAVVIAECLRRNGSELVEFWVDQLNMGQGTKPALFALGGSVFITTAIGGWLGAHLLPPRARR